MHSRLRASRSIMTMAGFFSFALLAMLVLSNCGAASSISGIATPIANSTATPDTTALPTDTPLVPTVTPGETETAIPTQPDVTATPTVNPGGGPPTATTAPATTVPATATVAVPTATSAPTIVRFAYLYSRVDYPLQIPLNHSDSVTLTLSTDARTLIVTPAPGSGSGQAVAPIPLPTDPEHYQDIAVSAEAVDTDKSPVVWQLTSAPRQSLLSNDGQSYSTDGASFHWNVRAVEAGANTARIVITLYYVYLDGSEHPGTIQVTKSPIPLVAVVPSSFDNAIFELKLPLSGLAGFGGLIGLLRFIFGLFQNVNSVTGTVKDAAKVAGVVRDRMGKPQPQDVPPTVKRPPPPQQ